MRNKEFTIAAGLWSCIFAVYYATMAPTVGFIDSGELATAASTLGIAHPTGYPLFTLLGRLFSQIPIAQEEVVRLNIMSGLFTSFAAVTFFFLVLEFVEPRTSQRNAAHIGSAVFASGALAFSQTFWKQGVSVEVYSLHLLLICLVLLSLMKAINTDAPSWWFFFALMFGLSFSNHLTTILLVPAAIYFFIVEHESVRMAFQRIVRLSVPFIIGLSVYIVLPIRAASHPLLNWGNPQTAEQLLWHVSGKQFRVWMFSSTESARKQLQYFIERVPVEYFYLPLIIAVMGMITVFAKDRKKFFGIGMLLLTCVGYSINYDIHDIDSYFLLAFLSLMIFAAYGMNFIIASMGLHNRQAVILPAIIGLVGIQVYQNWAEVDQRQNYYVEDYTKSILTSVPHNSIILSFQWDYLIAASYYFQHVRQFRSDVIILDKELFRRSWYVGQLEHMYPDLVQKSKREIEAFQKELYKFEHDVPYDYAVIEGRYTELLKSFIDKNIGSVSVFVTGEVEQQYTEGYARVPYGLLYQLSKDRTYLPSPFPILQNRSNAPTDQYINNLRGIMSTALYHRGEYERFFSHDSLANLYFSASKEAFRY